MSGNANDYSGWTRKQLEDAVDAESEPVGRFAHEQDQIYDNPQALWDTADACENVRRPST